MDLKGLLYSLFRPAAPSGSVNLPIQVDVNGPNTCVSVSAPILVGDSGSGGAAGLVPAPSAGSATAGKFLKADGTWANLPGSGGSIYWGVGEATVGTGQNQITFGSTPVAGSVRIYQNGVIVSPSLWSLSGAVATLTTNTFAVGADIVANWATANSTPGGVTLGTSGIIVPVIRGSNITSSGGASSLTVSLPSGTQAGDFALIFAASGYTPFVPSGWTNLSISSSGYWQVFGAYKTLSAADISTGSVTVGISGSYNCGLSIVTFVGATGGVRETESSVNGGGSSFTLTNTTTSAVISTDVAIYWATARQTATTPTITPASGSATTLGSEAINTQTVLAYQNMPGGAVAVANFFTSSSTGTDTAQVIVKGLSPTANPTLPITGGGGGSGNLATIDTPPTSPSTWDDEFNGSSLSGIWTIGATDAEGASGSGVSYDVNTTIKSCLQARLNTSSASFVIKQASVPSATGAFTCTVKCHCHPFANYMGVYLSFMNSTDSDGIRSTFAFNGTTAYDTAVVDFSTKDSGTWAYGRDTKTVNQTGKIYIQIQRDASNNWRVWFSYDGLTWAEVTSGNYSKTVTLDHMYLALKLNSATADTHFAVDFVRFNYLTLP